MRKKDSKTVLKYSFENLIKDAENNVVEIRYQHIENAKEGEDNACFYIGRAYYSVQWYHTAMAWFIIASKKGHAEAQRKIGIMYQQGFGVDVNETTALSWFYRSSWQGSGKADGCIHYMARQGFTLDEKEIELVEMEQEIIDLVQENDLKTKCIVLENRDKMKSLQKDNLDFSNKLREYASTVSELTKKVQYLEQTIQSLSLKDEHENEEYY